MWAKLSTGRLKLMKRQKVLIKEFCFESLTCMLTLALERKIHDLMKLQGLYTNRFLNIVNISNNNCKSN